MSTFVDTAINPKTGEPQLALYIDDYYGAHQYGVGFRHDGAAANLFEPGNIGVEYTVYPIDEIIRESDKQHRKL